MLEYEKRNSKWAFLLIGGILVFFVNYSFLDNLMIPDPCYYHLNDTNFLIDLFYNSGNASNGHPEPNLFNLLFTISIGVFIGSQIYNYYSKNKIYKSNLKS